MSDDKLSRFRPAIDAMEGYVPGEQPKDRRYVKLNTNENPYPPSPKVEEALRSLDVKTLCRYPDPVSTSLRDAAAELFDLDREWILAGNGSDDILTIAVRCFAQKDMPIASMDPSYSLYPILADIQDAPIRLIALDEQFQLPKDLLEQLEGCNLFFLTRPNAPTGIAYPMEQVRAICAGFDGIVFIDEAYVDFADDHCAALVKEYDNVIVCRTVSKSYSLANVRLGFAVANPELIAGMMKVKDSYNVSGLTQALAEAALRDQDYLNQSVQRIKTTRDRVARGLNELDFQVLDSQTNFLFAKPPCDAAALFDGLKRNGVLVRYFSAEHTREWLRITVGTEDEMNEFLRMTKNLLKEMS